MEIPVKVLSNTPLLKQQRTLTSNYYSQIVKAIYDLPLSIIKIRFLYNHTIFLFFKLHLYDIFTKLGQFDERYRKYL